MRSRLTSPSSTRRRTSRSQPTSRTATGPSPEDAARAITRAGEAGAVGGSIEDWDPEGHIYELEHAVERVAAAVEAARALDFPFALVGRAENHFRGNPDLDDTIKRLQAYEEAGADVLYAPGVRAADEIKEICDAVSKPVNVYSMGLKLRRDRRGRRPEGEHRRRAHLGRRQCGDRGGRADPGRRGLLRARHAEPDQRARGLLSYFAGTSVGILNCRPASFEKVRSGKRPLEAGGDLGVGADQVAMPRIVRADGGVNRLGDLLRRDPATRRLLQHLFHAIQLLPVEALHRRRELGGLLVDRLGAFLPDGSVDVPGSMTTTSMSQGLSSWRSDSPSASTPNLEVLYGDMKGLAIRPPIEAMKTIGPLRLAGSEGGTPG